MSVVRVTANGVLFLLPFNPHSFSNSLYHGPSYLMLGEVCWTLYFACFLFKSYFIIRTIYIIDPYRVFTVYFKHFHLTSAVISMVCMGTFKLDCMYCMLGSIAYYLLSPLEQCHLEDCIFSRCKPQTTPSTTQEHKINY